MRLSELDLLGLENRKLKGVQTAVLSDIKGPYRARLLKEVHSKKTRGIGHRLQ